MTFGGNVWMNDATDIDHRYQYNSKELNNDHGLGWYNYGARFYDAVLGRFTTIDRFAEKYSSMSPFGYAANNPIKFIDVNGDSIDLSLALTIDKNLGTNTISKLISQLNSITGLNISVGNNGHLVYETDDSGNPVVQQTDGKNNGSQTARNDLVSIINDAQTVKVLIRPGGRTVTENGGTNIGIDPKQIQSFVDGTPKVLNNQTLGLGMTFLHELRHTGPGGGARDPSRNDLTSTGPVVDRVNIYRNELDMNNGDSNNKPYGQRMHYNAVSSGSGNGGYLRFEYKTQNEKGKIVTRNANISF
jgi:RHS repeat-associated protein